jgi:hypothetical protein
MPGLLEERRYRYHKGRTDPEELGFRVTNLMDCLQYFLAYHPQVDVLEQEYKRFDINRVCLRELTQLKEFVNETGMKYENVYAANVKDVAARRVYCNWKVKPIEDFIPKQATFDV